MDPVTNCSVCVLQNKEIIQQTNKQTNTASIVNRRDRSMNSRRAECLIFLQKALMITATPLYPPQIIYALLRP